MDRTTLTFGWVPRTNKRTFLFHFGVYVTVFLFDESNTTFESKNWIPVFTGMTLAGCDCLRYAKAARRNEQTFPIAFFGLTHYGVISLKTGLDVIAPVL